MLKKTVTYTNPFTEAEVTEDLYFNLTEAEILKTAMAEGEGWADSLQKLSVATDGRQILQEFDKLLGMAYGKREGDEHIKSPEITQRFLSSQAYSTLFLDLIGSPGSGSEFFTALMPKNMDEILKKVQAAQAAGTDDTRPAWIRENREPTKAELDKMTKAELAQAFRAKVS